MYSRDNSMYFLRRANYWIFATTKWVGYSEMAPPSKRKFAWFKQTPMKKITSTKMTIARVLTCRRGRINCCLMFSKIHSGRTGIQTLIKFSMLSYSRQVQELKRKGTLWVWNRFSIERCYIKTKVVKNTKHGEDSYTRSQREVKV